MPSFVTAFLRDSTSVWALVNVDSGADLAARVAVAGDSASRRRGLLGRDRLDNEALVIAPCAAVHTCFMRFPIDVLFVDRDGRIVKCVPDVRPWRIAAALRAFATIEMAAGTIARTGTTRGHRVALRPASS
jgi:uncharacterized membrane protein (UPF0127 family)